MNRLLSLCLCILVLSACELSKDADFKWTMVDVNKGPQGDAHLLQSSSGKTILIDTGFANRAETDLLPFLTANHINYLDIIIISHGHSDHYGGLTLLADNVGIGMVYFNRPTRKRCLSEYWGCNPEDITAIEQKLSQKGIPLKNIAAGDSFDFGDDMRLEVLYSFNLNNSPVGNIDMNDESLIILVQSNNYRFLFPGDLNVTLGGYLAQSGENLHADVLKVPHHGTAGIAPVAFFEKVNPKYLMVPSPDALWFSERSSQTRNWAKQKSLPVYVNGIHGHVTCSIVDGRLIFKAEK